MPRARTYASNAQRQAAYRARLAERQTLAGSGQLAARLVELEADLAAANRRAETAEARAARAERDLAAALEQVAVAEATVADLTYRHGSDIPAATDTTASGANRAVRRQAERDRRRHRR